MVTVIDQHMTAQNIPQHQFPKSRDFTLSNKVGYAHVFFGPLKSPKYAEFGKCVLTLLKMYASYKIMKGHHMTYFE